MNERAWLLSTDPRRMLRLATGRVSQCCGCIWCDNGDGTVSLADGQHACPQCDNAHPRQGYRAIAGPRKLRLFACACCRLTQSMHYPEAEAAVAAAEAAAADGILKRASARKLAAARKSLAAIGGWFWCVTEQNIYAGLWQTLPQERDGVGNGGGLYTEQMAALLREIVGNPFDRLEVAAEYRTDLVVTMAKTIYAERAWGDLPILADALEEAGLIQAAVVMVCARCGRAAHMGFDYRASGREPWINCGNCQTSLPVAGNIQPRRLECPHPLVRHLRAPGPHARGCWALDVVLGHTGARAGKKGGGDVA